MTKLSSLVEDIYKVLNTENKIDDSLYEELANDIVKVLRDRLSASSKRRSHLSLSSVGKPLRRLWYDLKDPVDSDEEPPHYRLKFLYGDIIECIVLWLASVSGHKVERRQEEVTYDGIVGHIDSIIDGDVVDIKSASSRSFKKFYNGTLPNDDPFGYLAQIQAYDECVGQGNPAFLVMDKVTGELCLYQPDKIFDLPDCHKLIADARDMLSKDEPPAKKCYEPIPDGKSGNMKLDKGCAFCPYKKKCWQGLRAFKYADGVKYLTTIVNEPRVEEITL